LQNILISVSKLCISRRFYKWRYITQYTRKPEDNEILPESNEEIFDESEEQKNENIGDVDVQKIFDAEISRSGAQLALMLKSQNNSIYPAQRIRENNIKEKIKEICMEMMNEIISKYMQNKQEKQLELENNI